MRQHSGAQRFGQAGYLPPLMRAGPPAHPMPHGPGVVSLLDPRVGEGGDQVGDRHPDEQFARHVLVDG
ncbi:hypothetical protein OG909_00855 [Streptomyces sp. NBC_01754]|uniref:hypothetical protein n=1 Tax=Streptomyces sp. NBC_01754 TaxID=2975930 RepID=UPI002DD82409|nr:hypothetical protein [Streptomyces sp. NBC_01754]WSC90971.1 hypothetical protein OG909_00855 [Streptomyces sp. NBC_01754]